MSFQLRCLSCLVVTICMLISLGSVSAGAGADDPFEKISSFSTPQEIIDYCRIILQSSSGAQEVAAKCRYLIGTQMEALGKPLDATSEYLKIIINYPESAVAHQAETRLNDIYSIISSERSSAEAGYDSRNVFLSYMDSLGSTYIEQGQYARAIEILKKLTRYDTDREQYLLQLGDVYLNGLNNYDVAEDYYRQVLSENPDSESAMFGLAQTFRKKGDIVNAVALYRDVIEYFPQTVIAQYSRDAIKSIEIASRDAFIRDLLLIGPFSRDADPGFENEPSVDTSKVYKGAENIPARWEPAPNDISDGYINFNKIFPVNDFVSAYALTYIHSPREIKGVELRLGTDSDVKVWLNNEKIFDTVHDNSPYTYFERYRVECDFREGWNELLVKSSSGAGEWGMYLRLTDNEGNGINYLVVNSGRNNSEVQRIYKLLFFRRAWKVLRWFLIYGFSVLIFASGLWLTVLSVRNKIRINRMKQDFISNVSHQLKTPLTSIKMFAETLKMGEIASREKVQQYYDLIIRESDRLKHFIDTVLNFSKIEKGNIYNFRKSNLIAIIDSVIDSARKDNPSYDLRIDFTHDAIPEIGLDADTFSEALRNLIDNAIKYTGEQKRVHITLKYIKSMILIDISDNGIGIPAEDLEKVFDEFYRAGNRPHNVRGTGLGLNFVKEIVAAHYGRIAVKSEVGVGTTFSITLPADRLAAEA